MYEPELHYYIKYSRPEISYAVHPYAIFHKPNDTKNQSRDQTISHENHR